jgi:hypothetical protein
MMRHPSRTEIDHAIIKVDHYATSHNNSMSTTPPSTAINVNASPNNSPKPKTTSQQTIVGQIHDVKDRILTALREAELKGNPAAFFAAAREVRGFFDQILSLEERGREAGPVTLRYTIMYGLESVKLVALRIVDVDLSDLDKARNALADLDQERRPPDPPMPSPPPADPKPLTRPPASRPAPRPSATMTATADPEDVSVVAGWDSFLKGQRKL